MKNLIVYFSHRGENYWKGKMVNLEKGNAERAAEFIRDAVGGDLLELQSVKGYPANYRACVEAARTELAGRERPELKTVPESIEQYDNIFLCYPNWCGTMPMPVYTFLEKFNFDGKNIIPLCSNEGSGMGSSERDIKSECRGANVFAGLSVRGCETVQSESVIKEWAKESVG